MLVGGVDRSHKGMLFLVGLFSSGGREKENVTMEEDMTRSVPQTQLGNYTQKRHGRKLGFSVRVVDTITDQKLGCARKGRRWRIYKRQSQYSSWG